MENRQEFVKDIKVLASNYISREYAIDDLHGRDPSQIWDTADIEVWLNALPSAESDVPDTNVGELISRQAAVDEIDEWIKAFRENGHKESAADACLIQDGIIQLPSVQPSADLIHLQKEQAYMQGYEDGKKSRKGKWIEGRDERFVKCSECGMESTKNSLMGIALFGEKEPHFCPNCGSYNGGDSYE